MGFTITHTNNAGQLEQMEPVCLGGAVGTDGIALIGKLGGQGGGRTWVVAGLCNQMHPDVACMSPLVMYVCT